VRVVVIELGAKSLVIIIMLVEGKQQV